ncbi:YggT family protein [Candidatus Dojkabacteria bacterium]|nr:YggT family protein [Candidatus Dojkabacteria bacterium]
MVFRVIIKILYSILLAIETLIAIKFVLVFIGANSGNVFVSWITMITEPFIMPFNGILGASQVSLSVFTIDLNAFIAMIVYILLALFLIELLKAFTPTTPNNNE